MVQQTDLAPTLSILFGVPIPQNSLGVLLMEPLSSLSDQNKLRATYLNAQQVLNVVRENIHIDDNGDYFSLSVYCLFQ